MNLATLDSKGRLNLIAVLIDLPMAVVLAYRGDFGWAVFLLVLAILNTICWHLKQATSS